MLDKPQPWFALPRHALITLHGRDAVAFSQAQFMSDLRPLAPGQWQWSGWLTPKGRVIALFALLLRDAETVWLVLQDADPEAFATALRRFVFRSKVEVAVRTDLAISGTPCRSGARTAIAFPNPSNRGASAAPAEAALLDFSAEGGPRTLRISAEPGIDDPESATAWARFDLIHGLPRLPASQAGQWTPQQLSLDHLRAYSVAKGCYPGQEIVARTHFLGKAKRGLVLLEGETPLEPGCEVRCGEHVLGTIVSAAGNVALAVMPLERDGGALSVDGHVLQERPRLDGLARL